MADDEAILTISQDELLCPMGRFTIRNIEMGDGSGIWFDLIDPLEPGKMTTGSIFESGPYKPCEYGLIIHTEAGNTTYGFILDGENESGVA